MFLTLFFNYVKNNSQIGLVLIILVIFLMCVYYRKYFRIVYYLSKIPGPKTSGPKSYLRVCLSYLSTVKSKTHADITDLALGYFDKFTNILSLNIGPIPMVFIISPEYIQEILTNHDGLEKPWIMTKIVISIAGDSVITAHVPKWKRNRRKIVRGFSTNILKTYFKVMLESSLVLSHKLDDKLNDAKSFDILKYLSKTSLDSIARTTMGVNVNAQEIGSTLHDAVKRMFNITFDRVYKPWLLIDSIFNLTKTYKKFEHDKNVITKLANKMISEKKYQKRCMLINNSNSNEIKTTDRVVSEKSLLEILLEVTENDQLFDDNQLRDEVIFTIIAGFEATSTTLGYIFLNLAAHQDIQDKVNEELCQVLGDPNRPIEFEDLPKLQYMEMVIKESMRLHSTIPIITRKITKDIKLDNYLIPEGTTVIIPVLYVHRHKSIWKDPLKFDPERFTLENGKNRHPYAYLPFSAGPRNCLGIRYAWMFMKIIVATLLSRYEFHTDLKINELRHEMELSLKLLGGHQVRITPRRRN